jgi:hypothetical protein
MTIILSSKTVMLWNLLNPWQRISKEAGSVEGNQVAFVVFKELVERGIKQTFWH